MFNIKKNKRRYKMRDISIAIDYHNTGETLKSIGIKYNMSRENVRRIHCFMVRHVLNKSEMKEFHSEETSNHLKEYRNFLIENGVK